MNPLHALLWLAILSPVDNRPGLADLARFPSSEQCWAAFDFRCKHREWLEKNTLPWPQRNGYSDWLCELNACGEVWETVWRARGFIQRDGSTNWPVTKDYQRDQLAHLRDLLGEDAYYSGRFPPMVPVWRFMEIEW